MKKILLIVSSLFCLAYSNAQQSPNSPIRHTIDILASFYKSAAQEKIFLQLDKPYYTAGDTIFFKAYLFDVQTLFPSTQSGLLYIDFYADSIETIKQITVPIAEGLSWGEIAIPLTLDNGTYQIRAYTNWMRNFSEEQFFSQSIYIANPRSKDLLVDLSQQDSEGKFKINLGFRKLNQTKLAYQPLNIRLKSGYKSVFKNVIKTDGDGKLGLNFALPVNDTSNELILFVENKETDHTIQIPIKRSKPSNVDLQFFPESGSLVNGITSRIGFKAVGEDGMSVFVKGKIMNSRQKVVADFASSHKGMGVFNLQARAGEKYTAVIESPIGINTIFQLPIVKNAGIVMQIDQIEQQDSILIRFNSSKNMVNSAQYLLIGQSRNVVCFGRKFSIDTDIMEFKVASNLFPTGVARFSVLTIKNQPICERIIFINHKDALQLDIATDTSYATNDSILLQLNSRDNMGNTVLGNYSVSITDDSQVTIDSNKNDMISNLLLSADIKGNIEDPGYYFMNNSSTVSEALDCLLLTQGWTGFSWNTMLSNSFKPEFPVEKTYSVKGKVTNFFNKPTNQSKVVLLSTGKNQILKDTITDEQGNFTFDHFEAFDSTAFVLRAQNARGDAFNVGIELQTFVPAAFKQSATIKRLPWYLRHQSFPYTGEVQQTISTQFTNNDIRYKQGAEFLPEVIVSSNKIIRGSQNLNGLGRADFIIGTKELEKMGKKTLLQVLQEKIKGFREDPNVSRIQTQNANRMTIDPNMDRFLNANEFYRINQAIVHFVIDGQPFERYFNGLPPIKNFLEYCLADNIKGVELMTSLGYTTNYSLFSGGYPSATADIVYIEITTQSGLGPFFKENPGFYHFKPLPYYWPKDYYRPRFKVSENTYNTDRYATIHWQPNLIPDARGKASIQFFSASRPGTYTIYVQGSDFNGRLGVLRKKIKIQ
jgi:hypothetical protein